MERYKPKKHKIPVKAIGEHCIECMGGRLKGHNHKKLVSECPSPDCSLFDFRFSKNPHHRQNLSQEQRKSLADRGFSSPLIRRATGKSRPNLNDLDSVDT
jgi:hypothetical protein